MRVTDAMVERALEAMCDTPFFSAPETGMRAALEAALAPLPEPGVTEAKLAILDDAFRTASAEARAAEAKLAKARAWLRSEAVEASAYDRLSDILEGEP